MDDRQPTTGALVWHLSLRWRAAVDRAVAPLGLTHAQYSALASLRAMTGKGERPSQRQLAEYTGLGTIYMSKLVRALEKRGFIVRAPDPADARAVKLAPTDKGVKVIDEAMGIVRALNAELTAALGGPGSPQVQAFDQALQTLLYTAPEPGAAADTGEIP